MLFNVSREKGSITLPTDSMTSLSLVALLLADVCTDRFQLAPALHQLFLATKNMLGRAGLVGNGGRVWNNSAEENDITVQPPL